jgi:hypothetical protein
MSQQLSMTFDDEEREFEISETLDDKIEFKISTPEGIGVWIELSQYDAHALVKGLIEHFMRKVDQ